MHHTSHPGFHLLQRLLQSSCTGGHVLSEGDILCSRGKSSAVEGLQSCLAGEDGEGMLTLLAGEFPLSLTCTGTEKATYSSSILLARSAWLLVTAPLRAATFCTSDFTRDCTLVYVSIGRCPSPSPSSF